MPLALLVIGVILLVSGLRNTHLQLASQIKQDFTGSGNFVYWLIAIGIIGLIGLIPGLSKFSKAFTVLIMISFIIANKGFFNQFNSAVNTGTTSSNADTGANSIPAFQNVSSGSNVLGDIGTVASIFGDFL